MLQELFDSLGAFRLQSTSNKPKTATKATCIGLAPIEKPEKNGENGESSPMHGKMFM